MPAGSPIKSVAEVDQPGKRVAVTARSAYGLWLENNFKKGELLQFDSADAAIKAFVDEKMDAYAGAAPRADRCRREAVRLAHPRRPVHRGAAGDRHAEEERRGVLRSCATLSRSRRRTGLIASLIERHGTVGRLSVAPPA